MILGNIVNHPPYYSGECSLECIDAMIITFGLSAVIDFCKCNAFKYLWRYKNKNGLEDLEKAKWYCDKAISLSGYIEEQVENMQKLIKKNLEALDKE